MKKIYFKSFSLFLGLILFFYFLSLFIETTKVAKEEFGPRAALVKYEWFKDASAQLDAKLQNLISYKKRITNMEESYSEITRNNWNRTDSDTYNQWLTEYSGISANYNNLAAEYNSNSNKFNWDIFENENTKKLRKIYIQK